MDTDQDRRPYNTRIRTDLARELRVLAAQLGVRQNVLLEEAIRDLLHKYQVEERPRPRLSR